jgi:flavin-dependent dehydrogenase
MSQTIIAGGGLAGASAACLLAAAGARVLLIERQAEATDKICGEFISAEAEGYLAGLGIDLLELGAHRINAVRLVYRDRMASASLPFAGYGLSRRVLDEAILRRAAGLGAEIRRGEAVRLRQARDPIIVDTSSGLELRPATLFLATGKHDLRGLRRTAKPAEDLVGFKLHLRLVRAQITQLRGHVELIMLPDGYAGLQVIENDLANLCLLVSSARLARVGGTWNNLFADLLQNEPHLRARLAGAESVFSPVSITRVPYGFVHAVTPPDPPGIFRLGDQMGVIPSFTGDGMSIALHSAMVAARCHLAGATAADYHQRLRRDIGRQIRRATLLRQVARSAPGRAVLMQLATLWPTGMRLAARLTRVPPGALLRVGARPPAQSAS